MGICLAIANHYAENRGLQYPHQLTRDVLLDVSAILVDFWCQWLLGMECVILPRYPHKIWQPTNGGRAAGGVLVMECCILVQTREQHCRILKACNHLECRMKFFYVTIAASLPPPHVQVFDEWLQVQPFLWSSWRCCYIFNQDRTDASVRGWNRP